MHLTVIWLRPTVATSPSAQKPMRSALAAIGILIGSTAAAQTRSLADVQWMVGCWERTTRTGKGVELWSAPQGGMMMGVAYAVTDTSVREGEQLRMWVSGDTLVYEAHPSSQARTLYKTTVPVSGEVTFENPQHDFPQRIVYRRVGTDSLIARIEGDRANRMRPITYPFKRGECRGLAQSKSAEARLKLQPMYDVMGVRETREPGGRWGSFADYAGPGYSFVIWSGGGSTVTVLDSAALRRQVEIVRRAAATAPAADVRSIVTVERVRLRGDTTEALVSAATTRITTDTAGTRFERVNSVRWIDTWLPRAGALRLLSTEVISEEARLNGRLVMVNGGPPPGQP
jgi:hypothetical protein